MLIFLDIRKAFDSVDHEAIMRLLDSKFGTLAVLLFQITTMGGRVKLMGRKMSWVWVDVGIGQGKETAPFY